MNEIRCPHCGSKITGMARILLESALEDEGTVDAASPCPSCGKMISKKDIAEAQSQSGG
jgi:predicted RNA-binding Zn-ribbon protein involved in translation (DUF1610 family)